METQEYSIIEGIITDIRLDYTQISVVLLNGEDSIICIYKPFNSNLLEGIVSLLEVILKIQCHSIFEYTDTLDNCQRFNLKFFSIDGAVFLGLDVTLFKDQETQKDMIIYSIANDDRNESVTAQCTSDLLHEIKSRLDALIE